LEGILTPLDIVDYLDGIARPFVLLEEIELSLRRLIRVCVDDEGLRECLTNSLAQLYGETVGEKGLADLTFDNYATIICDGRNWKRFEPVFGATGYQRKETKRRLDAVREMRNIAFHFRRDLTVEERQQLAEHRAWLETKARAYEGERAARQPEPEPTSAARDLSGGRWNEATFLEALGRKGPASAVEAARRILDWARRQAISVSWGHGKHYGSFVPIVAQKGIKHQLFAVWSDNHFQFYFYLSDKKPLHHSEERLAALGQQFRAIGGIDLPGEVVGHAPQIQLDILADDARREALLRVYDELIAEIRAL
ncbi:MAG: hypothetical protein V1772_06940, partial [Chloroflexota bacterium]